MPSKQTRQAESGELIIQLAAFLYGMYFQFNIVVRAVDVPHTCNFCHADKSVNRAIDASKNFWAERFRAAEISSDGRFNQTEGVRALASDEAFRRALAVDSLVKHSDSNLSAPFLKDVKRPLVSLPRRRAVNDAAVFN